MHRFRMATLVLALVAAAAAGCSDNQPTRPNPVLFSSIEIGSRGDTLVFGDTTQFLAVVVDTAGDTLSSVQLSWHSSNTAIATVTNQGVVTGVGEGAAEIWASGGGVESNRIAQIVIQGFGWVDQTDGAATLNNLNGVFFASNRIGWAVGDLGTILRTTDAGASWNQQQSNSTGFRLNSVFFLDGQKGFVVGSAGRMLRTTNAGVTWNPVLGVDTDGGKELHDVFFVDSQLGFVVGNGGLILRTQNGGTSWTRLLPAVTASDLRSVWAVDVFGQVWAWAVGNTGTIVGTRNGGDTWRVFTPSVTAQGLRGVARRSVSEALAVGVQNTVALTVASGDSAVWILGPPPTDFSLLEGVSWPAAGRAFAVGENAAARAQVLRSTDGGANWTTQALPGSAPLANNRLRAVWFTDEHHGWAVGEGGLILHTATGGS